MVRGKADEQLLIVLRRKAYKMKVGIQTSCHLAPSVAVFPRLSLQTAILTFSTLIASSMAHAWSDPPIGPVMMTAPLTPPPLTGATFYVDKSSLGGTCNENNPGTQT